MKHNAINGQTRRIKFFALKQHACPAKLVGLRKTSKYTGHEQAREEVFEYVAQCVHFYNILI
jgi:hypothetical protein